MATLKKIGVHVETYVELTLNEHELCALDALFSYGIDPFLETFYKHMGSHYLKPHEAGLRSLAQTLRNCGSLADEAEECREFLRKSVEQRMKKV